MDAQRLQFLALTFLSLLYLTKSFVPKNNFLLNCGSNANASLYNRVFISDSVKPSSVSLSAERSVSLTDRNPSSSSPILYRTARVSPPSRATSSTSSRTGMGLTCAYNIVLKEFLLRIDGEVLEIMFSPLGDSRFAFLGYSFLLMFKCKKKKSKSSRRVESAGWTLLRIYGGSSYSRMSKGTVILSQGSVSCKVCAQNGVKEEDEVGLRKKMGFRKKMGLG
ncbi:hypothetical protein F3Y22_tig00111088pilonHSYRG00437 [Hibiscus syriacus]|uniref:Uncharacterized protein n=1 Tax=Hibiscus syriacus TaxID=106335 RepID=A0A6A2Z3C1_HIBSY|nr:hypothetical protein F3Y22_tig00111088pilonHSYRG00437 [Hibiscus syriacus]